MCCREHLTTAGGISPFTGRFRSPFSATLAPPFSLLASFCSSNRPQFSIFFSLRGRRTAGAAAAEENLFQRPKSNQKTGPHSFFSGPLGYGPARPISLQAKETTPRGSYAGPIGAIHQLPRHVLEDGDAPWLRLLTGVMVAQAIKSD